MLLTTYRHWFWKWVCVALAKSRDFVTSHHLESEVVTRVGDAHTDRVGGIDGVARAKAELVAALPDDGVAILNADDERVLAMAPLCRGTVLTYGFSTVADVNVRSLATDEEGRVVCEATISSTGESCTFRCPLAGRHMVSNAAAAIAVAHVLRVPLETSCRAIEQSHVSDGRMQRRTSSGGAIVIDDSYNANPTSTEAALRTLASLDVQRKIAVLGVMAEISDAQRSAREDCANRPRPEHRIDCRRH